MSSSVPIDPVLSTSTTDVRVRFSETDLMGIVHHASYLVYFEIGRVEWLRRRGVTYAEWAARGVHLPVIEANARYLAPARFDDRLVVTTRLTELRAASMQFAFVIQREGATITEGFTRLAYIDALHKPLRIPADVRDVLLARER